MSSARLAFLCFFLLGIAAALSFHSSGAVSESDALAVAAFDGGVATSPPGPLSTRALRFGSELVRLVRSDTGIFRAAHLTAGLLLALAAALSARVAHRAAGSESAGWIAGTLVAGGILFGADTGRLGLEAGPVATMLALLSGAAAAWTAERPRAAVGGLLLGLALAEHPLVLFLLPGFGALVVGSTLRIAPDEGGRFLLRASGGFLVGAAAIALPLLDARRGGILLVSDPTSFGDVVGAWWRDGGATAWAFVRPGEWFGGFTAWAIAAWRNTGPFGLVLGIAGLVAFFRGRARLARPFLLVHGVPALAFVLGRAAGTEAAAVLLGWSLLFWTVPTVSGLGARRGAAIATAGTLLLFLTNASSLNRSTEKGVAWASTVLETAPENCVLITENTVQVALAADGLRPDVDIVHTGYASSVTAGRTARPLLPEDALGADAATRGPVPPPVLRRVILENLKRRPVLVDPGLFFRDESRGGTRDVQIEYIPHGIAYRVVFAGQDLPPSEYFETLRAWEDVNVRPISPASPLRGDLTGSEFFARAIQTSGALLVESGHALDAERDFLLALTHPDANPTAAAQGLARVFFQKHLYPEAIATLQTWVRDEDPGAWVAYQLLSTCHVRNRDLRSGRDALVHALRLTPPYLTEERADIQSRLDNLKTRIEALDATGGS